MENVGEIGFWMCVEKHVEQLQWWFLMSELQNNVHTGWQLDNSRDEGVALSWKRAVNCIESSIDYLYFIIETWNILL